MSGGLETGTLVVSVVALLAWLVLNIGALRSHGLGAATTMKLALLWLGIFGLVALLANRFAS